MENKILNDLDTFFLGKRIDYYKSIESTHKLAKNMKDEDIDDGMIILAENQESVRPSTGTTVGCVSLCAYETPREYGQGNSCPCRRGFPEW